MAKQAPLTTSKMFTAHWTERDEAVLVDLLQRKIKELKWDMRDCDSPYARAKLKNTRAEYKKLLEKVQRGDYDPNILAAEMQSHAAYNSLQRERREQSLGKYVDAYSDVNFDFESYFKKTRYFGAACPLVMMILIIALLAVMLCSAFLSPDAIANIEYNVSGDINMSLTSIGYIKLGPNELDFQVANDGNWPTGTWADASEMYEQGEKYQDANHQTPDKVWLYADLHMTSINITVFDVIKAWFRTPMLSETRIDIIENLDSMQGTSWYYQRFMRERSDNIAIEKDENGDYNARNIVRHIATYGTIIFLIAAYEDRESALSCAGVAACNRSVKALKTGLFSLFIYSCSKSWATSCHIDYISTFRSVCNNSVLAKVYFLYVLWITYDSDNNISVCNALFNCISPDSAFTYDVISFRLCPVINGYLIACFHQISDHGLAHDAYSNKTNFFHIFIPFIS